MELDIKPGDKVSVSILQRKYKMSFKRANEKFIEMYKNGLLDVKKDGNSIQYYRK